MKKGKKTQKNEVSYVNELNNRSVKIWEKRKTELFNRIPEVKHAFVVPSKTNTRRLTIDSITIGQMSIEAALLNSYNVKVYSNLNKPWEILYVANRIKPKK